MTNLIKTNAITLIKKIADALRLCYDPEIPVNIVDLGLIYGITVESLENGGFSVIIYLTFTAPACPMSDMIMDEIKHRVATIEEIKEISIEIVFDPPWSREMISLEARLELGLF